jgi:hypothetical protein
VLISTSGRVILSIGIYSIGDRLMRCCILEAACMLLNFAHDASTSLAPIVLEAASQDLDCWGVYNEWFWERRDNGLWIGVAVDPPVSFHGSLDTGIMDGHPL